MSLGNGGGFGAEYLASWPSGHPGFLTVLYMSEGDAAILSDLKDDLESYLF